MKALALAAALLLAQQSPSSVLREVRFDQKPGAVLPKETPLIDERGRTVAFGELLRGRPVVLALVYYRCPMLCSQVTSGLLRVARAVALEVGRDYDVVALSIDPDERPELAAAKQAELASAYGRGLADGWRCLTGAEPDVRAIADAVGFRYVKDEASGEYAHAAGLVVLTPDGVASRWLFGVDYAPRDLKLALVEASQGTIGGIVEALLLICFHYDPASGKYGFAIVSLLRLLGLVTVATLAGFVVLHLRRERRARRARELAGGAATGGT